MKFVDFPIASALKKSIQSMGWNKPTDIQYKAIFPILKSEDVLAIAQTGTGKTASFVIPTLQKIIERKKKHSNLFNPTVLVMVPTRELAEQILGVYEDLAKGSNIKSITLMGGVDQDDQIKSLKKGVDVVIATPGRFFDLVSQGHLKTNDIQIVVLDEADHMLDLGFVKDIRDLVKKIPKGVQTLFFSATIDKRIKKIAYELVTNAIRIQISPKNPVAKNINHSVTFVGMDDKRFFLENLIREYPEKKIICFVRTKIRAERVLKAMERVGIKAEMLHGGVEQDDRFKTLDNFKSEKIFVLITTDVAARGIDIPNVFAVINYDLPEIAENYVHRVGRTGRGKNKGQAISFCSPAEMNYLTAIEEYTGEKIERYDLTANDYKAIIEDSEDINYDWKKLMQEANKEKSKNEW